MMSFYPTPTNISAKPHIRQEGFVPDDPFTSQNHQHGKYSSPPLNLPSMDFGDELAGLMAAADTNANNRSSPPPNGYYQQQQQHVHQDDYYRHNNVFDTSASRPPPIASSSNSTTSSGSIGPARTSRTRRNGSISGTSPPPPLHSLSHGHPQHHGHHAHAPSLSHSLSHSGTLNGGLNSMGSMGGYAMGMNSLDGSMGMMGMANVNDGLSLGSLQTSPGPLSTPNNNNSVLSTSLPSPPSPPLPPSVGSSPPHSGTANVQDKQTILANEKRRRRRESHNAVERRRRDNINEKISELATLIPECMLDGASGVHGNGGSSPSHLTPTSPGGMGLLDSSDLSSSYDLGNGSSSPIGGIKEENAGPEEGGVVKANKGMILRKSVDYIRYLQQLVTAQGERNRELELELEAYRTMNGGGHFNGMVDNNHAGVEHLRGRTRVARCPNDDNADENTHGGGLKEEIGEDDDVLGVVGGFGIGVGRMARGM